MLEPDRVAECVAAMCASVSVPVTVKMRVGVVTSKRSETARHREPSVQAHAPKSLRDAVAKFDEADFEALHNFVSKVYDAGCRVAIVHARKAVLGGLSPKDNREIPPLRFDIVERIKQAFPQLPVIVNGGIRDSAGALQALTWCEGVMLGREAYHRPFVLRELHHALYPNEPDLLTSREQMLERMARYAQKDLARGGPAGGNCPPHARALWRPTWCEGVPAVLERGRAGGGGRSGPAPERRATRDESVVATSAASPGVSQWGSAVLCDPHLGSATPGGDLWCPQMLINS